MKTLIAYATKHGCAEKCAIMLSGRLDAPVELLNLRSDKKPDLAAYDRVVIGGSLHMGTIQKQVTAFCQGNLDTLKEKTIGLFICCMEETEEGAQKALALAFPAELRTHATVCENFGGEFTFGKMNLLERMIVRTVGKVEHDVSRIQTDRISCFAEAMNSAR